MRKSNMKKSKEINAMKSVNSGIQASQPHEFQTRRDHVFMIWTIAGWNTKNVSRYIQKGCRFISCPMICLHGALSGNLSSSLENFAPKKSTEKAKAHPTNSSITLRITLIIISFLFLIIFYILSKKIKKSRLTLRKYLDFNAI